MAPKPELTLPLLVTSPVDVGRLVREVETLDNSLMQQDVAGGGEPIKMPKTSLLLDAMIDTNKLNLTVPAERQRVAAFLQAVHAKAPVIHISFSADPAPAFIEKLMTWLRREINAQLLITVGLQPNIGAGCLVRTTNKYYDFSLRQNFTEKRALLMEKLHQAPTATTADSTADPTLQAVSA